MDDTEEATKVSTMGDNINTVSRRKKKKSAFNTLPTINTDVLGREEMKTDGPSHHHPFCDRCCWLGPTINRANIKP